MMLRMFLPVLPGTAGDIPFAYLTALRRLSVPVRALPIGVAGAMAMEKRWYDISDTFTISMSIPFINVVCAPAGLLMGTRLPIRKAMASDEGVPAELRQLVGGAARRTRSSDGDVVYEPPTALTGLWTNGVKNVAIIYGDTELEGRELVMLEKYDRVFVPEARPTRDATWKGIPDHVLADSGVRLEYVPPDPYELVRVLEPLCASVGTATTPRLAVMPERPATTSPPSSATTASSSRSPASPTGASPQSRDTSTSTSTRNPFRRGETIPLATRTWRFITRSLGFSKR